MAFKYRPRTIDQVRARAEQSGGNYDRWYTGQHKTYKSPEGDNHIRILPATWEKADNYGMDIFLHYGVGPDNQRYLCPKSMGRGECPVCEAGAPFKEAALEAEREGDKDKAELLRKKAGKFRAGKQILMWVIDRKHPEEGPTLYGMPYTMEKEISDRSIDRETRSVLNVDDPDNGYDVYFKRTGTTQNTKYTSVELAREPSPLSRKPERMEKWLEFIQKNPIPSLLKMYDYDHIAKAFNGSGKSSDDADADDDDAPKKTRRSAVDDDDDAPPSGRSRTDDDADDAPPKKVKAPPADDDDTPDADDDDAPPKKARPAAPAARGTDDDDNDLDADDAPPPKKKAKAPPPDADDDDAPPKKKARPADDDDIEERPSSKKKKPATDDDDDIPF